MLGGSFEAMRSTRVSQHVRASRPAVYRALLDADAIARWRVPDGMTSQVHEFEAREGGSFRVSLTYDTAGSSGDTAESSGDTGKSSGDAGESSGDTGKSSGKSAAHTDTYHGHFRKLVPDEQVVEVIEFETTVPEFAGTMTMTTTLTDADGGTDVLVVHEGIPAGVSAADNETGTRMALEKLAHLVEAAERS